MDAEILKETGDEQDESENIMQGKLYMVQCPGLIKDSYEICDEEETVRYRVEGGFAGLVFRMTDPDGLIVLEIKKRLVSVSHEYHMIRNGITECIIKKKFNLARPEFMGELCGEPLKITGDISSLRFGIYRAGQLVGNIEKDGLTWGEVYAIEADSRSDMERFAALAVVICSIMAEEENNT